MPQESNLTSTSWLDMPRSPWLSAMVLIGLGLLLCGAEQHFCPKAPVGLLAAISLLPAAVFALLTACEISVLHSQRRQNSPTLIGTYMLFKAIRLLLTIGTIAAYVLLDGPESMAMAINMLLLFFAALTLTTIINVRAEQKNQTTE